MSTDDGPAAHPGSETGPEGSDSIQGALPAFGRHMWACCRRAEILERSMAFAALCFVTLVPLLIVIAAASSNRGNGIADWITNGLGLPQRAAKRVKELFVAPGQVLSTTTALGLAALAVFGVTMMASLQRAYERVWDLRSAHWLSAWRQVLALAGLTGYVVLAAWCSTLWPRSAAQPALGTTAGVSGGVLVFWWLPRLLLSGRVRWAALLPGAVATMVFLVGLRMFSRLVFAPLIVSNALSYGAVGTVLVIQSWFVGVGFTVYLGAALAQTIDHTRRGRPGTSGGGDRAGGQGRPGADTRRGPERHDSGVPPRAPAGSRGKNQPQRSRRR
ncbi:YhjD/YihY/BrkB family envelope integrity protein [Kitasatospora sp. NPDC048545]|uniref:YhjD/YihY/BrkB family envelope integrity protein n=1 Tax=Kitasatospora sp. NPDC048545 TaxID=3157208 RepID=UPI0033F42B48